MSDRAFDALHRSAAAHPDREAFVGAGGATTYRALAGASQRFARGLRACGIGRGERVAILLDGEVEYLVAYYGILEAGAVAVPLAPQTRGRALGRLLAHCGAAALVLGAEATATLPGGFLDAPRVRLVVPVRTAVLRRGYSVVDFAALAAQDAPLDAPAVDRDALAVIHYTSGTTGQPKGAMLSHRNLVANVRSIVASLGLTGRDRAAMVLPFHNAYGSSVLHTHLAVGGTIIRAGSLAYPASVLGAIRTYRCTGLAGVPSTFVRLFGTTGRADLGALRYVTVAGAALPPSQLDSLRANVPHAEVFVMYGQTEATARLACLAPASLERKRGSVGRAIPGVELSIRDADGNELPRGTVGEVVARGENVMLGYFDDPSETARVLRPEGLRTGDLARMDDEGFVYVTGRASEMIKSGGHRISPLEIEEVVLAIPGVLDCAVVGRPDEVLGEAIVAFVIRRPRALLDERTLLRACLAELPRAKVPGQVRFVDQLPRTPNGKLRRLELKLDSGA